MKNLIDNINLKATSYPYLEFSIQSFIGGVLTIVGSEDLTYYHDFEITFVDVCTFICNNEWKIDTSKNFISIIEGTSEAFEINLKYMVENGNTIFKIITEDCIEFYIISKEIYLKDEIVRYGK